MSDLPLHNLSIVLVSPQIAPNTGNIARLCVATGTALHIVRPMGFVLTDRQLRRSAMDYWPRLKLSLHDDLAAWQASDGHSRQWLFDSSGIIDLWDAHFRDGDALVFGSETRGLSPEFIAANPNRIVRIPQTANERCLNLATSAGIALYEALRRLRFRAP
ncbi:MAG: tRNA (cytidine(34)-2'-O)-methyltransferase [Phycisphaerae bacterium]|nr:tRNA (cytidine(34)-2'-O)-methyltransferase [Phycisphaerae bacterium]